MGRLIIFIYGTLCYLSFLGTFLYAVGFVGNFWVPKSLDVAAEGPLGEALLVNALLLAIFGVQHSVMARPTFKRWWTRFVPEAAERSTYVLFSNLAMVLLFWQWRPMGGIVWDVQDPAGRAALYALFGIGWLIVLASSFMINHFDLFGMRQVYLHLRGIAYTPLRLGVPGLYKHIRHPLYVGWMMAPWAAPTMTAAHLVFAAGATLYILVAIVFEERNLLEAHGSAYAEYRRRTPMFIPRLFGGNTAEGVLAPARARID